MMEMHDIEPVICINKDDLAEPGEEAGIRRIYGGSGYRLLFTSVREETGIDEVRQVLRGKVTAVAGPSGVGKSSIINALLGSQTMETGEISRKLGRGKQTTRHTELLYLEDSTFIFDSPGFSAMELPDMEESGLDALFPEIRGYIGKCRYSDCSHTHEPDCMVKEAALKGDISPERYESYKDIYRELSERRKY